MEFSCHDVLTEYILKYPESEILTEVLRCVHFGANHLYSHPALLNVIFKELSHVEKAKAIIFL